MSTIKPPESIKDFLDGMDESVENCDVSTFSLYMSNVFSKAENAFNKGYISKIEMIHSKTIAAGKIIKWKDNCKCNKIKK
jgi:hypothetical protein